MSRKYDRPVETISPEHSDLLLHHASQPLSSVDERPPKSLERVSDSCDTPNTALDLLSSSNFDGSVEVEVGHVD